MAPPPKGEFMILEIDVPEDQWKLIERKAIANSRTIPSVIAGRLGVKVNSVKWHKPKKEVAP